MIGEVGREKAKGALGELNHDRIVGLFYISLIPMLALPARMSFKGQRQLTTGFAMAILHPVYMKIRKEGGKGEVFEPSSKRRCHFSLFHLTPFCIVEENISVSQKKKKASILATKISVQVVREIMLGMIHQSSRMYKGYYVSSPMAYIFRPISSYHVELVPVCFTIPLPAQMCHICISMMGSRYVFLWLPYFLSHLLFCIMPT